MKCFSNKSFLIFFLLTLFNICIGEGNNFVGNKGISVAFLKKRELMAGDSWSNKPLSVADVINNLSKYDAIWCAQLITKYNPFSWHYLRKNNPKQLMLYYISGNTAQVNGKLTCLDYDYINTYHPEWFLLADMRDVKPEDYKNPNKRIRWNPKDKNHSYYNRFFIDVGNKEFQQWAAQKIVERVSGKYDNLAYSYDGLAMDNVGLRALEKLLTKQYPHWKYVGNPEGWVNAYFEYIKVVHEALKANGYILVVNHTTDYSSNRDGDDWEKIMQICDGLMDENTLGVPKGIQGGSKWLWTVKHHENTLENGLIDWWVCQPASDKRAGYEQFLYMYCTFLLTKTPGKSFFYASEGISGYENPEPGWYEEYDLPIGKPLSTRYQQDNCWARDYFNAKIIVNPTTRIQAINIDKEKYWLDWTTKKSVKQLVLKPQSGRIFLKTTDKEK